MAMDMHLLASRSLSHGFRNKETELSAHLKEKNPHVGFSMNGMDGWTDGLDERKHDDANSLLLNNQVRCIRSVM